METQQERQPTPTLDEITLSFQREAEALREIVRGRDLQIKALKAHALCMRENFKQILTAILDKFADADIQFHAKRMIEQLDQATDAVDKVGQ